MIRPYVYKRVSVHNAKTIVIDTYLSFKIAWYTKYISNVMQKPCAVNACCFKHVFNNQENKIQNQYMKEIISKTLIENKLLKTILSKYLKKFFKN